MKTLMALSAWALNVQLSSFSFVVYELITDTLLSGYSVFNVA